MSGLTLNQVELNQIKSSWNKINKVDFYPDLYVNLFELDPQLRSIFNNNDSVISYHCDIFGDLFNFVIDNIDDASLIDEFLYQFVNENQRFSSMAGKYLEPMGNALIQTFRDELSGQFTSVLELVWIKVFVFVANSLLQYEEDIVSESSSLSEDAIPPLNIQRERMPSIDTLPTPSPPLQKEEQPKVEEEKFDTITATTTTPVVAASPVIGFDNSKPKQILDKFNSIEIDLNSNNKYKGFRRSVDVAKAPIHVPIPQSPSFQKTHSNMSSSLKNILASTDDDNNNNNNNNNTNNFDSGFQTPRRLSFDPRRKNSSNPTTPKLSSSSSCSTFSKTETTITPFESPRLSAVANGKFASQQQQKDQGLEDVETDNEEFSTPRASRRGSFSESYPVGSLLHKLKKFQDPEEQQEHQEETTEDAISNKSEDSIDAAPFDPRMRRRRNEELNHKLIPSPESSEVDEQEEEEMLMNKLSPATETTHKDSKQSVPERSLSRGGLTGGTFDYQSFGLKGLAPIVEDDDASSKYESDGESSNNSPVKAVKNKLTTTKSSGQGSTEDGETNSRTSSLSLNNSDYKSSISSGTADADHYAIKGAGVRSHSRNLSTASSGNDFDFTAPVSKSRFRNAPQQQSSLYSLGRGPSASTSSINSTSRASLGFMRSSFVLKKEMQTQGYNEPENVCMSMPVTPRMSNKPSMNSLSAPPAIYMNKAASVSSFGCLPTTNTTKTSGVSSSKCSPKLNGTNGSTPYDSAYDLLNTFDVPPPLPIKDGIQNKLSRNSSISSKGSSRKKGGLRSRLSSIFSSKSSSSSVSSKLADSTPATSVHSSRKPSIGSSSNTLVNSKTESQGSNYATTTTTTSDAHSHSTRQSVPLFSAQPSTPSIHHIPPIIKKVESSGVASSAATSTTRKPASVYGHRYGSVNDLTSVYSTDTTTSGFSMFKRRDKNDVKFVPPLTRNTRKGNKYNVKKVPYDIWA